MTCLLAVLGEASDSVRAAESLVAGSLQLWGGEPTTRLVPLGVLGATTAAPSGGSVPGLAVDQDGSVAVLFDGRLDNAAELVRSLDASDAPQGSELILRAYQRWGDSCAQRLIGDFAVIIWNWRHRTVIAFRDPFGVRPLCFSQRGGILAVASDPALILSLDQRMAGQPDDHAILEHLLWRFSSLERTFWTGIRRIPPGHVLSGRLENPTLRSWWTPSIGDGRYSRIEEVDEHLLQLFQQSVARRMSGSDPVLAHLSGGLDSSSIVCASCELLKAGTPGLPRIVAISERFPGQSADESTYIDEVIRWTGVSARSWTDDSQGILDITDPEAAGPAMRTYRTTGSTNDLEMARTDGASVILSGQGGDQFGSCTEVVYDMIRSGPLSFLWETFTSRALSFPQRRLRLRKTASAYAPGALRARVARRNAARALPSWLDSRWVEQARQIVLSSSTSSGGEELPFPDNIRRARWRELRAASLVKSNELLQRAAARQGVTFCFPFLDQDLVLGMLSVPARFWPRPNQNARLHRRAFRRLLPPRVATRTTKAFFSGPLAKRIRANRQDVTRLFHAPQWCSDRYVAKAQAMGLVDRALRGDASDDDWLTWRGVWGIATLEAWLRRISGYTLPT